MKPIIITGTALCVPSTETLPFKLTRVGSGESITLQNPTVQNGKACYAIPSDLLNMPSGRYIGQIGNCKPCLYFELPNKCSNLQ